MAKKIKKVDDVLRRGLVYVSLEEEQYSPQEKSRMAKIWSLKLEREKKYVWLIKYKANPQGIRLLYFPPLADIRNFEY